MPVARQREYETVYILRPNADEETVTKTKDRVEGVIANNGGHLLRFDNWGMRRLAYDVRDKTAADTVDRGVYHCYRFIAPNDLVAELERQLRITDAVIKFMTVKLDDDLIADERLAKPTDGPDVDVVESEEE